MRYYVVDAFADALFQGNPAGVCLPGTWPKDAVMQAIAAENNLSETAFAVKAGDAYGLRWFTPAAEISLCGHATLATAATLFLHDEQGADTLAFDTMSGRLTVTRDGDRYQMDFPLRTQTEIPVTQAMRDAVGGAEVLSAYAGYNLMLALPDAETVRALQPDFAAIRAMDAYHGVIVTARGDDCDFVSRFFVPGLGINEDPVTGSTHTSLVPYWAERLGRTKLTARQLSRRGGTLHCTLVGDRVLIAGTVQPYLQGELLL